MRDPTPSPLGGEGVGDVQRRRRRRRPPVLSAWRVGGRGERTAAMLAELFGPDGLIVFVVVALVVLFGGTQLPKLARGLASASREFRRGAEEGEDPSGAA